MSVAVAPVQAPAGRWQTLRGRVAFAARHNWPGLLATAVAVLLVVAAVAAPLLSPYNPTAIVGPPRLPPSGQFLLGTDGLGRDVLSRTLWGARHTLITACLSTALASVVGVPLGLVAGYLSQWMSDVVMRAMDVLLAFPGLLLALIVVTILGPGVTTVVVAVGVSYTPIFGRLMYGPTRSIRTHDYIAAARVVGYGRLRVLRKEVLPVLATEVVVLVSSAIGWTTLLAATLDFLGFGIRPPAPDWGADLSAGIQYLRQAWWISAVPGLAITVTILVSNYLGDFVASIIDPDRLYRSHARVRDTAQALTGVE